VTFHPLFAAFALDGTLQPGKVNVNSSLAQSEMQMQVKLDIRMKKPDKLELRLATICTDQEETERSDTFKNYLELERPRTLSC
jgi:hypothetical protein